MKRYIPGINGTSFMGMLEVNQVNNPEHVYLKLSDVQAGASAALEAIQVFGMEWVIDIQDWGEDEDGSKWSCVGCGETKDTGHAANCSRGQAFAFLRALAGEVESNE